MVLIIKAAVVVEEVVEVVLLVQVELVKVVLV
jgi:hypothetical protein